LLFSVAASQGRQLFDGVHLTAKYFFDAIDAQFSHAVTYRGIESKGAIRRIMKDLTADIDEAVAKTVLPLVARKQVLFISTTVPAGRPWRRPWPSSASATASAPDSAPCRPAPELSAPMVQAMQRAVWTWAIAGRKCIDQALSGATPDLVIVIGDGVDRTALPGVRTVQWPLAAPVSSA
jgi:arsenate reductase